MFRSDRILALDIGASKLVVAEFTGTAAGMPQLTNYGIGQLGVEPDSQADTSPYIVATLREIMREHGIRPAPLYMSVSGQAVFPRYVKLPPVSRDKVMQIIQYEAEQNVPFPIEEVVWDYQLLGATSHEELNVMLVAVKTENVTRLTDCVQAAGLEPQVVDVAPMALYNTVRFNYPEMTKCAMVLDMGARTSNLIFIEQDRIFSRSIPVAGNAITQELAKEFEVPFAKAEELKLEHAFVALGGVYAGPDNEVADRVSKIVRNVVTRLHAEVNRSINFYRSQQGGSSPALVLLTGGSSIMPHTDTFFREKLKVDVDYLNPFANIAVSEQIDAERIGGDLNCLGEVSGLALRRSLACPVEMNLMPPDLKAKKAFRKRQPFFALTGIGVVLIMLCWWVFSHRMRVLRNLQHERLEGEIAKLSKVERDLKREKSRKGASRAKLDTIIGVVRLRTQWLQMLDAIHTCLLDGMWLRSLTPITDRTGLLTDIEIKGRGFEDKLRQAETAEATPIEVLRDRLRANDLFTDQTEITFEPPPASGAYAREFTVRVALAEPIQTR